MKALILSITLLTASIGIANAYEIEGNPDRKISFGFNYDYQKSNSEYSFRTLKIDDFTKVSQNSFLLDARVPLSSLFTFSIRGGYFLSTNDIFTNEKVEYKGFDVGFGLRVYIP